MRWFLAVMPALLAGWLWMPVAILAAEPHRPADTDPAKADEDFRFQGEYIGTFVGLVDGKPLRQMIGAQVVALGDGKFSGVGCRGGLPTTGSSKNEEPKRGNGTRAGGVVNLEGLDWFGGPLRGIIEEGRLTVLTGDGTFDIGAVLSKHMGVPFNMQLLPPGAVVLSNGPGPMSIAASAGATAASPSRATTRCRCPTVSGSPRNSIVIDESGSCVGEESRLGTVRGRSGRLLTDFASCTPDGPAYNGESIHEPD